MNAPYHFIFCTCSSSSGAVSAALMLDVPSALRDADDLLQGLVGRLSTQLRNVFESSSDRTPLDEFRAFAAAVDWKARMVPVGAPRWDGCPRT